MKLLFFVMTGFGFYLSAAPLNDTFYKTKLETLEGKKFSFAALKGKPVLIVNTASKCGYTPQLQDLETLNKKYGPKGLVILAVPSDDFKQEPGNAEQILSVAHNEYKTTFPILEKQKITGSSKSELYKILTSQGKDKLFSEVKWNFEKFLVDKNGHVVQRWLSSVSPTSAEVVEKIEAALK